MGFYYPPQTVTLNQLDGVTVGSNEPAGPNDGDLWIDLATGQIKVWLLGAWRTVGADTPTGDRYGTIRSSIPGFTQQAGVGVPASGDGATTLPAVQQKLTVTVDVPTMSLADLSDVDTTDAADGAELVWDDNAAEWQPSETT